MPIVYMLIVFGVLAMIGLFWFLQNNQSYRVGYEMPPVYNKDVNAQEMLLVSGLRKIDMFSDKGKWLLFLSVFLLLIEFFVFIAYFIRNTGIPLNFAGVEHLYFLGGLLYFFILILAIFLSIRLTSTARELPHLADGFSWPKTMWEQKLQGLSDDQRQHLSFFVLEKSYLLEQSYSTVLILLSSASTLLLVWLAYWLFSVVI